jgi:hypothetical protein
MSATPDLISKATVDVVALQCGIRPINEVALALRADASLHAHGDFRSVEARRGPKTARRQDTAPVAARRRHRLSGYSSSENLENLEK